MRDERLAYACRSIRRKTPLSQRALRDLSGVSFSMIQLIEDTGARTKDAVKPSPTTLEKLASGAATDPESHQANPAQAKLYYGQLMEAAGYLDAVPNADSCPFGRLAHLLDGLPQDDREFVVEAVRNLIPSLVKGCQEARQPILGRSNGTDHRDRVAI